LKRFSSIPIVLTVFALVKRCIEYYFFVYACGCTQTKEQAGTMP